MKYPLAYDCLHDKWKTIIKLKKGKHYFKFIVDGNWEINPSEPNET